MRPVVIGWRSLGYQSNELSEWRFTPSLIASDASIETALKPVKLFKGPGEGGCDIGSRFAVQPLWLTCASGYDCESRAS